MSDYPLAAALARLHAEHPDLPTDGGRVWEPVQPDAEDAEAPTPLARAEQAVTEALGLVWRRRDDANLNALIAAVEARYEARLREGAPADACQLHGPTGEPCDCGHAAATITNR